MRGMNSESVDLIYLDPPFNSNANYAAPIGSEAAGAEFKDTWTLNDIDIAWLDLIDAKHGKLHQVIQAAMTDSDKSYLIYMAIRLLEMHRLLKPTGSIYLHCDPTMSHYLKLVMDAIFGRRNFRNEIIWCYTGPGSPKMRQFNRKHDVLFWFSAGPTWTFNGDAVRIKHKALSTNNKGAAIAEALTPELRDAYLAKGKIPETWWPDFSPTGRIHSERTGYPTQKPLALLRRIIQASCPKDGIVFDPFCGCATTCVAAEIENREWTGIDIGSKAYDLVKTRLDREIGLSTVKSCINRTDTPQRTDLGKIKPYNHSDNKKQLYGDQGGNCTGCGEHFRLQNFTVDHIIPTSKGGTDHIDNLQLLCGYCNSVKGDRGQEYLIGRLAA